MLAGRMVEAQVPESVREAVEAVAGGPVVDGIETASVWKFPHPDGSVTQAPVWLLRTSGQVWIAAAQSDDRFRAATGDPEAIVLTRGWARDQVKVGDRIFALARKSEGRARALIEAFAADSGGPAYPAPASAPLTGPLADGAIGFPDWWAAVVPGDPEDPWLFGCTMATEWTFNVEAGSRSVPLVVGVRGRAVTVAAHLAGQTHAENVDGPIAIGSGLGRTRLELGPYRVDGSVLDGGRTTLIAKMGSADEPTRWAMAAAAAMDDGRATDAVALWKAALQRGHRAAVAVDLAVVALAVEQPQRAVTLLREAGPSLESGWMTRLPAWRRALAKDRTALMNLIDETVRPAEPPGPGWPWPPTSPAEAWAAAGGPVTLPEPPGDPRRLHVEAAVAEQRDLPEVAAAAYRVAARAYAAADQPASAYRTLRSALRLDPDRPDNFQAACWARAARAEQDAEEHARAGLAVAPDAEPLLALGPSQDELRWFAGLAEDNGQPRTAAKLLVRALELTSAGREERLALARRLGEELGSPQDSAELLARVAEQADGDSEDNVDALWLEVAELYARAGNREATSQALQRAVQAGFLRVDVYRSAAGYDEAVDPSLVAWWHHIGRLLSGQAPDGEPRPSIPRLNKEVLDGLHPGGAGWLADVKQWLDVPTPPARDQLTRGLERLESSTYGPVFQAINDVSARLEMMAPSTYVYRGDDAYGFSAWPVHPPVLLVGHQHLVPGPRLLSGDALTFAVAVELVHLACGHPLLSFESSLLGTSNSAYQAFGRFAGTAETVVDLVSLVPGIDQIAKLQRLVKLSKRVLTSWKTVNKASNLASPMLRWFGAPDAPESGGIGRDRLEGAALQFRIQADRAALLVCGNIRAAVEAVLKMSRRGVTKLDALDAEGLAPLLRADAEALAPDTIVRLSALLAWAAGLGPANIVDPRGSGV